MQEQHEYYMRQCLDLAEIALAAGDPPVGSIIVLKDKIIGRGIECGRSTGDVTDHAEILAVKDALKNGYADQLHLSVMYTTHEPCIMCAYVIRHYRISEIIYGIAVPHIGGATSRFNVLTTKEFPKWTDQPDIISGVCAAECNHLSEEFAKALTKS